MDTVNNQQSTGTDQHAEQYIVVDLPIRLTVTELARLTAASGKPLSEATHRSPFSPVDSRIASARDLAVSILERRKRREAALGFDLFGEPAWDILLDLFIQHVDRQKTSSTSAAIAARVPPTTALRYLNSLVRKGLVVRHASDHDLRVQYVALSELGYREMLAVLTDAQ